MTRRSPQEPPPNRWALPDAATAPEGVDLVGIGADLDPGTLLAAYRRGLFPMHVELWGEQRLGWWSPDPRGVVPLDGLHISRSLRRSLRHFTISVDTDFDGVVDACATEHDGEPWILPSFKQAYGSLHRAGWAHSIEVRNRAGDLAGGLYGVAIGGFFAGESMFHRERDASKAALVGLVELMSNGDPGTRLLDVQWATDHLVSLGATTLPRREYLERLEIALADEGPAWLTTGE